MRWQRRRGPVGRLERASIRYVAGIFPHKRILLILRAGIITTVILILLIILEYIYYILLFIMHTTRVASSINT